MISGKIKTSVLILIGGALGLSLMGCSRITSQLDNDYDFDKYYVYVNPEMEEFSDISRYDQMTRLYLTNMEIPDDLENEEEKLRLSQQYDRIFSYNNQEYRMEIEKAAQWEMIRLYDPEGQVLIDFDTGNIVEEVVNIGTTRSNFETKAPDKKVTFTEENDQIVFLLILNTAIIEYNYVPVPYNFNLMVLVDFK